MRIELASLQDARGSFDHQYQPGELEPGDDQLLVIESPRVSGSIRLKDGRVNVIGRLTAKLGLECDRCLKAVELPADVCFEREFVTRADYENQRAVELEEEDLDLSIYDGEAIDLDSLVNEELLLAVPGQVLCAEDCRGLCPTCGIDRNSAVCKCETKEPDPRWAGLKDLVNNK